MQIYLVGGAVRDKRLGLEVKDRDWVVVGATPAEMLSLGFKQVGADFPVFLHPKTGEEYALARTERKQGQGYHGFTVYSAPDVTLEDDLRRRDLTINAMAETESGDLVDPFNGLQDLERKQLRHVSDAFAEDPLRILRTARFAARLQPLGFSVHPDTLALMRRMVDAGELEHLVAERVWQECQRALNEQAPHVFLDVLRELGALKTLIPELTDDGVFSHGRQALTCVHRNQGTTAQRLAALLSGLPEAVASRRAKALKSPNECRELTHLVALLTEGITGATDQTVPAARAQAWLDAADAWRRPERLSAALATLECTVGDDKQALVKALSHAANAAQAVSPQPLLQQGYTGKALGEAIHRARLERISEALAHH
ncbi:MAG: multifunctional CCA tRNA nucleotidyl transferase/2'3'-cyclic phosphodiesterase/2'nucleotidase/phosphatase [Marinobacter sp. 34-60-7]|nr:MAG: multifunctional CCA tRNA nucleotidyl transferase/2'3'-cyclic phosphodiesterase/2'nucleotidase/phosphatase [Marinobacter sp. 34-60-7]